MASSTIKQVVPVDLVVSIKNATDTAKSLKKDMEEALSRVDPGSSLYKTLGKGFDVITKKLTQLDALTGKPFFSDKDLKSSLSILDQISTKMAEIKTLTSGASVQTLGLDTTALKQAQAELIKLQTQARDQRNQSVGQTLGGDTKLTKRLNDSAGQSGFDPSKSFSANISKFQSTIGSLNSELGDLESAARTASKKVTASKKLLQAAETDAAAAAQSDSYITARQNYGDYQAATLFSSIKGTYKGRRNEQVVADYQNAVRDLVKDGKFVEGGEEITEAIGRWLKIDPEKLQGPAQNIVDTIVSAIDSAVKNGKDFGKMRQEISRYDVKSRDGAAITASYKNEQSILNEAKQKVADAQAQLTTDIDNKTDAKAKLDDAKKQLKEISSLLDILIQQKDKLEKDVDEKFSKPIQDAKDNIKKVTEREKAPTVSIVGEAADKQNVQFQQVYQGAVDYQAGLDLEEQRKKASEQAAREQERFTNQLNQSISRWMSAGQIIQYIKSGIREAWQDVQSLDKAMTNIAVVTDMSVGDLWGKINEYMSVAKEYGVTTQGVYEVSQLFFQQGLSANDVMAATTETLKMARQFPIYK